MGHSSEYAYTFAIINVLYIKSILRLTKFYFVSPRDEIFATTKIYTVNSPPKNYKVCSQKSHLLGFKYIKSPTNLNNSKY